MGKLPVTFLPTTSFAEDTDVFFGEVLTGWKRAQLSRNFTAASIKRRLRIVQRFADFTGTPPWLWTSSDADDFFAHLRSVKNLSISTVRAYQTDVRLFLEYSMSPDYPWNEACGRRFGHSFSQIVTDLNRARHVSNIDASPEKRPFTVGELQQFFDLADLEVERCLSSGRKGGLSAWRDAIAFKTLYGWGLRADEMRHLQVVDWTKNRSTPYFGECGLLRVRWGKAMKGSPKKERTVYTTFQWAAEAVDEWIKFGLPRYGSPVTDLFPTDGRGLISLPNLRTRMYSYVAELGFPSGLDLHSLRRSYASHLEYEHGYDRAFVSLQMGHEHQSTTSIYSTPSPDYAEKQMNRALNDTLRRAVASRGSQHRRPDERTSR